MSQDDLSLNALRDTLRHLYDPKALLASPLSKLFGLTGRANAPSLLQRTLIEAIEALAPQEPAAQESIVWRPYQILYYHYVEKWSHAEVADQLGLSLRHLKREQNRALELLAQRLREQFNLAQPHSTAESPVPADPFAPLDNEDLRWLSNQPAVGAIKLAAIIPAVLATMQPMAAKHDATVQVKTGKSLPAILGHAVALRQILLSLLTVAIRQSPGGRVQVAARSLRWHVEIQVCGESHENPKPLTADDTANLAVAHQLAHICGGQLTLPQADSAFLAIVLLPAAAQVPVLAIDDNLDTLQLLQRYVTDTRYRIYGAQTADQAFTMAVEIQPQVILLDVMMPDVDGWELLGRLQQHPATSGVPIIACTILPQEELALSLGVSGFLQKPLSRRALVETLDRLLPLTEDPPPPKPATR